jgi:hypothetical protein
MRNISYDPGDQEWFSIYYDLQESAIPVQIFSWDAGSVGSTLPIFRGLILK